MHCNLYNSGALQGYEAGLRARLGDDVVDLLNGPTSWEPFEYTVEDLRRIHDHFRDKIKELKNGNEAMQERGLQRAENEAQHAVPGMLQHSHKSPFA